MRKKTIIFVLIFLTLSTISIVMFYPQDLIKIIGKELDINSNVHLTITHRNSILEDGTSVESYKQNDSEKILEYFKSYKYSITNTKYKKLDNTEYYIIKIENKGEEVFRVVTRGDKHLSVTDKNGNWRLYKVVGNTFNTELLKDLYKSLSNKN